MKKFICDACHKESQDKEDIPEYLMFCCDSYDGMQVMLCFNCEKHVKNIFDGGLVQKDKTER